MANPQKENGFTPIANEILEALARYPLNGTQWRILMVIFRYTYGFNRKEAALSEGYLSKATGIDRRNIRREIGELIRLNLVTTIREANFTSPRIISFNKDFDKWVRVNSSSGGKNEPEGKQTPSSEGELAPSLRGLNHPPRNKDVKKAIKKDELEHFFESIWSLYPYKRGKGQIKEAKKKTLYEIGYEQIKRCIQRYKESKPDWQQWQYGSTFFNSGYIDYLDENYERGQDTETIDTDITEISDPGFLEYYRSVNGGGSSNE